MRLCLVEDMGAGGLEPLTLTRPVHELLLGASSLGSKLERAFGIGPGPNRRACLIRPHLSNVVRERDPHRVVNDRDWMARGPVIVANSRWVPPSGFEPLIGPGAWVGRCEGQPAFAVVGPEDAVGLEPTGVDDWFDRVAARYTGNDVGGEWITRPWDLVSRNGAYLTRDFKEAGGPSVSNRHLTAMALVGPSNRLRIHETAKIDPYTVLDTTNGPIVLGANAWVQSFTRIEGPCAIGAETQLFRANLRGSVTIGPNCRIGGEVEAAIVHGFSNKYHEGFLGHAYVGQWVNLGAITSNSDLRNDYGEVSVPLRGDPIPTGQTKIGCFIGDHTRTGMGSLLNTGTSVGVMCNVLPAGVLLPKHIPSFTAVMYGRVSPGFPMERLFETAQVVMGRRGQTFSEAEQQLYSSLYDQTRLERERAFHREKERHGDGWPVSAPSRRDRPQAAF